MSTYRSRVACLVVPFAMLLACGAETGPDPEPPPPCDQECRDEVAMRGMRETMKLVFNLTFQGKAVGMHDFAFACPLGGKARIFGTATSEPVQGATEIDITYELDACKLSQRDDDAPENYDLAVTGTVRQTGILAVQPTSTTALGIRSDAMTIAGTVYAPPLPFTVAACPMLLAQNGSRLTGTICGRQVTVDL